jgi:hypothetical protein
MIVESGGRWPKTWPSELEPFRARANTGQLYAGSTATVYEIEFKSAQEFNRVWPALLKVKSKKAPIVFVAATQGTTSAGGEPMQPQVHIVCPTQGTYKRKADGSYSHKGPWTKDIKADANGVLPQFVEFFEQEGKWKIVEDPEKLDPMHRPLEQARVEMVLYVDGEVINPDRISLPADTPVKNLRTPAK